MTLLELITDLRVRLLDDTGGEGVDWTDDANARLLRWSNEELTVLINEAMRETARRVKSITANYEIALEPGISTYYLDPNIFKIRRAKLDGANHNLDEVSWKDLDAYDVTWETKTGEPKAYILDWEKGQFRVAPIPEEAGIVKINVYRYPEYDMEYENWESDEPELEVEYQRNALYWAAKLAYEKEEPNVIDPGRVAAMNAEYIARFGVPESAYAIERKKRAKRSISYGGIGVSNYRFRGRYKNTGYW